MGFQSSTSLTERQLIITHLSASPSILGQEQILPGSVFSDITSSESKGIIFVKQTLREMRPDQKYTYLSTVAEILIEKIQASTPYVAWDVILFLDIVLDPITTSLEEFYSVLKYVNELLATQFEKDLGITELTVKWYGTNRNGISKGYIPEEYRITDTACSRLMMTKFNDLWTPREMTET